MTYEQLLGAFWDTHSATLPTFSVQYASIIFYHGEAQRQLAMEALERRQAAEGKIYTRIAAFTAFYPAEQYHQKYYLQGFPELNDEFVSIYPKPTDWMNSTAVARVNGYLGGYGTEEELAAELGQLGLSPAASKRLHEFAQRNRSSQCPVPLAAEIPGTLMQR